MFGVRAQINLVTLIFSLISKQRFSSANSLSFFDFRVNAYCLLRQCLEQVDTQLQRTPEKLSRLVIKRKPDSIYGYKFEDFELVDYKPKSVIKARVAV